jgi:hypothetical protein
MKKIILGLLLLVSFSGWGQQDTLEYTTPREVADTVFGLLDKQLYDNVLFDRSLSEDSLLMQQLKGVYTDVASAWNWLQAYSDVAVSYTDPAVMLADSVIIDSLSSLIIKYDKLDSTERVYQPFGVLLHQVSKIDSNLYQQVGSFTEQNSQLKLSASINENQIYDKVTIKETALLELYGDHGYEEGVIVYNSNFISVGSNIVLHAIQIDVGNGFQNFSSTNNEIDYNIYQDWQIGKTILDYTLEGIRRQDTLSFFLTSVIYNIPRTRGVDRWDTDAIKYPSKKDTDLKYVIKYGCGNGAKIRRPIIIAPPYRPGLQPIRFNKYYDQFDFKSLISSLSDMGYDVIFIKQTPGNRGIDHSGDILAGFLKHINQKKKQNYPNEDWENIVIGFSAGGQHWRWALKKLEMEHMDWGTPHHHTRLYIPYDSPHWGVNIPMFTQSVYKEMSSTLEMWGILAYKSLKDAASKDMAMNHILGSQITHSGKNRIIEPHSTSERENIVYHLENSFNHQFSNINDLRKTFPAFTRNVAVSVGGNTKDYTDEYALNPGMKLFQQNFYVPRWYGGLYFNRHISSSQYNSASSVFFRNDVYTIAFAVPLIRNRHYKTKNAYEWDMAQGGYKNEFFDKPGFGFVPIDPVSILRVAGGFFLGTKLYNENMLFLPMVSALAINPSIWQNTNNNLYYNLKEEGLMFNKFNTITPSNLYGYPNLGHPNTHFSITPFEAIYCDPQTYEHIKMAKSVEEGKLDETYLVHTRNFILDEVEADIVYLQNKIIGKNHNQWVSNYRYKAWYKAYDQIIISTDKSPKTDPGPFIIEETGEVTVYACNSVGMGTGFEVQQGGKFHAYVQCDSCSRPREQGMKTSNGENNQNRSEEDYALKVEDYDSNNDTHQKTVLKVYPNPSDNGFTIEFPEVNGDYTVTNTNGKNIQENKVLSKSIFIELPKGIYFLKWRNNKEIQTKKIIAL